MKNKFLLPLLLFAFQLHAQPADSSKKSTQVFKKNLISIFNTDNPQKTIMTQSGHYRTIPTLTRFLDTASSNSIRKFINETPDSVLRLVEIESESAIAEFCSEHYTNSDDKDGDGHRSIAAGGDDCNDLNFLVFPGNTEVCSGYIIIREINRAQTNGPLIILHRYMDEDCDPSTISLKDYNWDGDEDHDGAISCSCSNYTTDDRVDPPDMGGNILVPSPFYIKGTGKFILRGPDCDDHNSAIVTASQQCLGEGAIRVCENGSWKIYSCKKCVVQPNGTGTVTQW
jgi:hypothetical protein